MPHRADILAKIETFSIDGPDPVALPFAARLAREHGWKRHFAERVVREYKRFAALAVTRSHPVCPSEQVDAAWHLHLTYTRSYWKRFCGEVLGQPLHHDPTTGGPAEADKHHRMYEATLTAYRETFGEDPPADIWPPAEQRFGPDARHVVVNTSKNWVIPKAWVHRLSTAIGTAAAVLVFGTGCVGGMLNPFDLVGTDFLYFLIPLMISSVIIGRVWRSMVQYPGPQPGDENEKFHWEHLAYMTGGAARLTSAAIARMIGSGAIRVSDDGKTLEPAGPTPPLMAPSEAVVWGMLPLQKDKFHLKRATDAVNKSFADQAIRLRDEGYMLTGGRKLGVYLTGLVPLALVMLVFGFPRLLMGFAHGKPSVYLALTVLFGGFFCMLFAIGGVVRATRRGTGIIENFQNRHANYKKGGLETADAAALAVALFGTAVLLDAEYAALATWYPQHNNVGSGCSTGCGNSGGSSGDSGSGCSSGCGGCGGGD